MGNSVTAQFNDWLGSNVSHVANAYSKSQDEMIWLCLTEDKLCLDSVTVSTSPRFTLNAKWRNRLDKERTNLVRLPYRDFVKLRRNSAWAYLTGVTESDEVVFHNYQLEANRSVIIAKNGCVKPQKYGGDLWTDEHGNDHSD